MPYTIIVGADNSLYGSRKRKILQREKLFNKLWFLASPYYNGYDMSRCTVTMRYLLPISKEFITETLVLSDEKYEEYLKYILPIDSNLTKEWGDIELNLTFTLSSPLLILIYLSTTLYYKLLLFATDIKK